LVELLAVIAILALLASLAFPALQRSMESTKSARCVSNLRAIGAAAQQFASDNNGRILTWGASTFDPFCPRWPQGLAPTLGSTGPEAQWTLATLQKIYRPLACPSIPAAYTWGKNAGSATYAANSFSNPGWGWPSVYRQNIERPASTIYLLDGWGVTFSASSGQDIVDQGWPPKPGAEVFFPHQGRCNALFLDGHVESFLKVIPAKYIRP
jgi:general secretion pathway protein G